MAIVKNSLEFEGKLGGLSFYKRRDSDKLIMRTKGGPSKKQINTSKSCEGMRLQQTEWKGCTIFASALRLSFWGLHRVADYT